MTTTGLLLSQHVAGRMSSVRSPAPTEPRRRRRFETVVPSSRPSAWPRKPEGPNANRFRERRSITAPKDRARIWPVLDPARSYQEGIHSSVIRSTNNRNEEKRSRTGRDASSPALNAVIGGTHRPGRTRPSRLSTSAKKPTGPRRTGRQRGKMEAQRSTWTRTSRSSHRAAPCSGLLPLHSSAGRERFRRSSWPSV